MPIFIKSYQRSSVKSPNILAGHEGELMCVVKEFTARSVRANNFADGDFHTFKISTAKNPVVVMFLECGWLGGGEYIGYIDFLYMEKHYRHLYSINRWMEIFTPWPRGGFVEKQ